MSTLITAIGGAISWLWTLFSSLLNVITENPVLLYVVLVPILIGVITVVLRILRKFGVR